MAKQRSAVRSLKDALASISCEHDLFYLRDTTKNGRMFLCVKCECRFTVWPGAAMHKARDPRFEPRKGDVLELHGVTRTVESTMNGEPDAAGCTCRAVTYRVTFDGIESRQTFSRSIASWHAWARIEACRVITRAP